MNYVLKLVYRERFELIDLSYPKRVLYQTELTIDNLLKYKEKIGAGRGTRILTNELEIHYATVTSHLH